MERPTKIYREEPVKITGIEVRHTYAGLIYLIEHYRHILDLPSVEKKVNDSGRQHIRGLIDTYNNHLQLLQNEPGERGTETEFRPGDLPTGPDNVGTKETGPSIVADVHGSANPG